MSVSVAAVIKKVAVAILSDDKARKKIGIFILSILVALLMPIAAVLAVFSGSLDFDSDDLQEVIDNLDEEEIAKLQQVQDTLDAIEEAMRDADMHNFMTNAVKYCDHSIRIRLSKTAERVEFSITNDGAGIEQKDLEKVWDVLYSSPKGRSESEENSGVGLSVVKDILDAHNARYSCSSSHKGTNFWFSMDVYEEE